MCYSHSVSESEPSPSRSFQPRNNSLHLSGVFTYWVCKSSIRSEEGREASRRTCYQSSIMIICHHVWGSRNLKDKGHFWNSGDSVRTGREGVWQRWLRLCVNGEYCVCLATGKAELQSRYWDLGLYWEACNGNHWQIWSLRLQCEGWVGEEATLEAGWPFKHCSLSAGEWWHWSRAGNRAGMGKRLWPWGYLYRF